MKEKLPIIALVGFLAYAGTFIFVYLWRAFRGPEEAPQEIVQVWHGDPFMRAILVAILFLIGLVILVYVALARRHGARAGHVRVRDDLWQWLEEQAEETNESPNRLTERAVAAYRDRLEGTRV